MPNIYGKIKKDFLEELLVKKTDESKKVEKKLAFELEDSKNDANYFFELGSFLYIVTDFCGNILEISSQSIDILGYSIENLKDTNFFDLIHPDDLEKTISKMYGLKVGKAIQNFENRCIHANGTSVFLNWSADSNKSNTKIFISAHDITTNKSKRETIDYNIDGIVSQWRESLSNILAMASGIKLKNEFDTLNKDEITKYSEYICNEVNLLSKKIDDFSENKIFD